MWLPAIISQIVRGDKCELPISCPLVTIFKIVSIINSVYFLPNRNCTGVQVNHTPDPPVLDSDMVPWCAAEFRKQHSR